VLELVPLAAELALNAEQISRFSIGRDHVNSWRVPTSGAAVLLPDREAVRSLLVEAYLLP